MQRRRYDPVVCLLLAAVLAACADASPDNAPGGDADAETPVASATYAFASRFQPGADGVSYTAQTFRQVLIEELGEYVKGLTKRIDEEGYVPAAGEVVRALRFYYDYTADAAAGVSLARVVAPPARQRTFADFAGAAKLSEAVAGKDPDAAHRDFNTAFAGRPGITSADGFVGFLFGEIERVAVARANGAAERGPDGAPLKQAFVTAEGVDLQEAVKKFLYMAVAYSQATDDELDDAEGDEGVNADNTRSGTNLYTSLEHEWDEGFGYFGAARNYGDYTPDEAAGRSGRDGYKTGAFDADGDGAIDYGTEMNFMFARYAARIDAGASPNAPTTYKRDVWDAFRTGRAIIAAASGPLSAPQKAALKRERDKAVAAWEGAVAATVVRYINAWLRASALWGGATYDYAAAGKVWSEAYGLVLGFQFNPRSRLTTAQLERLTMLFGVRPAAPNAGDFTAYKAGLMEARGILAATYGFAAANVGDENGENGW